MSAAPSLTGRLVLIGAGKMGTAMLQGWLEAGVRGDQVTIFDPAPPPETMAVIAQHSISHNPSLDSVSGIEAILVAVKPQMVDEVLPAMASLASGKPLVVSVVAGKTIAAFQAALWKRHAGHPYNPQHACRGRSRHHRHGGK